MKLTTFSTAKKTEFDTKLMTYSETKYVEQFSKFCLCQQLFAFKELCMETRLRNILKTTNATKFIKSVLESSYKVLLGTYNLAAPTRLVLLLRALEI